MDTILEKTQAMHYASEALPELFHSAPEQFFKYLTRDGNQLLRFYWDQAGKTLGGTESTSSFGLNYEVRKPFKNRNTLIALITLPKPQIKKESYFLALAYRPHRVTPLLRISDTTLVVALEYNPEPDGTPSTLLVEWTRRLVRDKIGKGPEPNLADFYRTVVEMVRD